MGQALVVVSHPGQYATDANLRARQRFWAYLDPPFDLTGWVVAHAAIAGGTRVLDAGCGNGAYLTRLPGSGAIPVGCDLSMGMLRSAEGPRRVNADVQFLPFHDRSFDVVLAMHMLYHVRDKEAAAREMRRVLVDGGTFVAVTNGSGHIASLRRLVESVVGETQPGWRMTDWATRAFSLEQGREPLSVAFEDIRCIRPAAAGKVVITDADVVADYVASVGDAYQGEVNRPWSDIVGDVRSAVQAIVDRDGAFITAGETGAFVCR